MRTPIEVKWDGKFRVDYRVDGQESSFRCLPEAGRLFAAAPTLLALLREAWERGVLDRDDDADLLAHATAAIRAATEAPA